MSRLDRLREGLGTTPFLVSSAINVRYLTGLQSSNAYLLVEPDRVRLFTDFRYIERADALDGVEAVQVARDVIGELPSIVSGGLAFEAGDLTYEAWERLHEGGLELEPTHGVVERLRAIKDDGELAAIRRACAASDRAFEALAHERFTGRSERELAWRMEQLLREHGGEGLSFEPLVAAGPSGSSPHSELTDDPIPAGTLVIVDAGCTVDGYCSDCTRTFATGELPEELRRIYDLCLEAQLAAVEGIRPGLTGREADAIARDPIAAAGYGERFGHGLGHGLGLLVHEAPAVRPESDDVLAAGQVFSVEPGIYLPGVAGVRIEDLVVLREEGPERLTTVGKELTVVD
jgi:Xaa-Pro aminopeptidase